MSPITERWGVDAPLHLSLEEIEKTLPLEPGLSMLRTLLPVHVLKDYFYAYVVATIEQTEVHPLRRPMDEAHISGTLIPWMKGSLKPLEFPGLAVPSPSSTLPLPHAIGDRERAYRLGKYERIVILDGHQRIQCCERLVPTGGAWVFALLHPGMEI